MKTTYLKVAMTIAAISVAGTSAYAQFVPVVAKMKRTEVTIRDGKTIQTKTSEGVYCRKDDGSYYQRWTKVNGKAQPGRTDFAGLFDNSTGTLYRLDLTNHLAYQRGKAPAPVRPDSAVYKGYSATLAQDNVEGIPCVSEPTKVLQPDGKTNVVVGTTCESVEYNLELKHSFHLPQPDGTAIQDTYQLYDIHIGTEPDPSLFELQKNFKVYRPDGSQK